MRGFAVRSSAHKLSDRLRTHFLMICIFGFTLTCIGKWVCRAGPFELLTQLFWAFKSFSFCKWLLAPSLMATCSPQEIYSTPPPGWYRAEPEIRRADQRRVAGVWTGLSGACALWRSVVLSQQITAKLHLDSWSAWQWGTVHAHRSHDSCACNVDPWWWWYDFITDMNNNTKTKTKLQRAWGDPTDIKNTVTNSPILRC